MIIEGKVDVPIIRKKDLGIIEPTSKAYEVGRLQAELSQLERHFNYLESELSKLGRSDVRTSQVSPADSGHGRLFVTIPKGRPKGQLS